MFFLGDNSRLIKCCAMLGKCVCGGGILIRDSFV